MTGMTMAVASQRGFDSPVDDSQQVFRGVLEALSRPGSLQQLVVPVEFPGEVSGATAAVLLALTDYSTPIWFDDRFVARGLPEYLKFHTGAPVAELRSAAVFGVVDPTADGSALDGFALGTAEYPDRSATLILEVPDFGTGQPAVLEGPGIDGTTRFAAPVLSPVIWTALQANSCLFPLGLDIIFTAGDQIAAIPRSTKIEVL